AQRTKCDALAIDQNQSLLRQDAAQVELDRAIASVTDVQVDCAACLLRNELLQVGGTADAEFFNVLRPIRVHRIGTGLFRCGNVCRSNFSSSGKGQWLASLFLIFLQTFYGRANPRIKRNEY